LQSSAVASLPASAGNNSRGSQSISNDDRRQVQGGSTYTSSEEDSDNRDGQVEDDAMTKKLRVVA